MSSSFRRTFLQSSSSFGSFSRLISTTSASYDYKNVCDHLKEISFVKLCQTIFCDCTNKDCPRRFSSIWFVKSQRSNVLKDFDFHSLFRKCPLRSTVFKEEVFFSCNKTLKHGGSLFTSVHAGGEKIQTLNL